MNLSYIQKGNCCVLASYALIVNHFSNDIVTVDDVFYEYLDFFKPKLQLPAEFLENPDFKTGNENEDLIAAHYHFVCFQNDIRGLQFVHDLHSSNYIKTSNFGSIKSILYNKIDNAGIICLKTELFSGGIAQVVVPGHSFLLYYALEKHSFFKRDPSFEGIEAFNEEQFENIFEFLVFKA